MKNNLIKKLWVEFTEMFGASIIHPQSLLIRFQKQAIEEAKKHAKGQLIDIGCGRMPYRKELEPLVDSYIGVDHPEVSKLYCSAVQPDVLADAKKLPFPNNSFDIALLLQVLEHVDSPKEVIIEASRVLKPSGVLVISVPFFYPLHDMPHDWGRYTNTALKSFIESAELHLVKIYPQGGFFEFWLQMLNTFLVKRLYDIIRSGFSTQATILLPLTLCLSLPVILVNNLLILLFSSVTFIFPKYPDYFPLQYLLIAKKKNNS